jgi:hypothetical protein
MGKIYSTFKNLTGFSKFLIAVTLVISIFAIYLNLNTKRIVGGYKRVLGETCGYTQSAMSDISNALSSQSYNYVETLQRTRAGQIDLEIARRVLDIGLSEIDTGFRTGTILYRLHAEDLGDIIENSIDDSIDIAIEQGSLESVNNGYALEGIEITHGRLDRVNEICNQYK